MKIEIEVFDWVSRVEIRWFDPLGSRFSPEYRELEEELEAIDGVERVTVLRYSASVKVAGHAATLEAVASDVVELLQARYPHATIEQVIDDVA